MDVQRVVPMVVTVKREYLVVDNKTDIPFARSKIVNFDLVSQSRDQK